MNDYNPRNWFWIVGGDQAKAFSSSAGDFVPVTDETFAAWREDWTPTQITSMEELVAVLREANVPPYHRVRKSTIIARLTDPQLTAALNLLNVRQRERWRAADHPAVNADDPETLQVLAAIGADAPTVMAPE